MAQNKTIKADITADPKGFNKGINAALKDVKIFGKSIGDLGGKLGLLAGAAAIGAVVKGLYDMASQLGKTADRLLDLEQITGISTDKLQQYEHVARIAGVSSETMATAVQGLTQRMARGGTEAGPLNDGLKQLGMSIKDSSGNIRNGGEVMEEAIGKLAEMQNVTERNVLGAKLFSGAWKDLAPVLALGKDGINAAMKEAKELGLVMDKEALQKANEFRIEMEVISARMQAFKRDVAQFMIPAFQWIIDKTTLVIKGWKAAFGMLGDINQQAFGSAKSQADKFIESIDSIIDKEERRAKIVEEIIWYQNKARELWASSDKDLKKLGDRYEEISKTLAENLDHYSKMKQEEISAAEAAAAAEAELSAQIERDRLAALGEIGRLQEDLAAAEQEYIKANSDAERGRWLKRKGELEAEIELLKEKALAEMWALTSGPANVAAGAKTERMPTTMANPMLDTGHAAFLEQQAEKQFALKQTQQQAEQTAQSVIDMNGAMLDSAYAIGAAFGEMAANSDKSTEEILGNMLKQVVGAIINSIMVAVPFPANLLAAAGAGALGSSLFSSIPGFATGTDYAPGGMAWVGERGPELVNLPRGSQVFTNQESMGMGGKVEFEIKGRRLRGILNSENSRLNQIG
jgi:hypothetical protein